MREWLRRLCGRDRDAVIESLIEENRATPRRSMEAVDWRKVERAGARNWHEVLRGQRRVAKDGVLAFRRRA